MKSIFSERTLVVILFIAVVVIFSLAQEDTRKLEMKYNDSNGIISPTAISE
jgi:hypothetical protein